MKKIILLFLFSLSVFTTFAQTGAIRGFIYDKESGEPIIFTNVFLKGTTIGASTDVNGYYMISKIEPGDYTLMTTFIGYDTSSVKVSVTDGGIITRKLYISPSSVDLNEFVVSAEMQEARTEVKMSVVKITPKEIRSLPTVGGEADIAQYLQVLPGVTFTGDQGGQLYIRGGSPIQNKVLLDGMIIYNPFHTIGLFSVFDTDIIRNADVYTGGFGAEYGGRISSIMDITTRDGNKKKYSGKIGASPFGMKAMIEGPLFPKNKKKREIEDQQKKDGTYREKGTQSFILTFKKSYLDKSSESIYKYLDNTNDTSALFNTWEAPPTGNLPFSFRDIYGKISFAGVNGSKMNLFGFNFKDQVNYPGDANLNWNSSGGGANFVVIPGSSAALIEGVFAYSKYTINLTEGDLPPKSSTIDGFNGGLNFTYFLGENEVKYGLEVLSFATDYSFYNEVGAKYEQAQNTTEAGAFIKYKLVKGKMVIDPSIRMQYYASLNTPSLEPRLGMKYNISNHIRMKFAAGLYSQNLISGQSDRDVVNIFNSFLTGPTNLQDSVKLANGTSRKVTHSLQKARHAILGFEFDLSRRVNLNVEGYYKRFNQLTNINRNKIYEDIPSNSQQPDVLKKDFIVETGDAYGIDFVLKYDYKRLYLWFVYSFGNVTRFDGVQTDENGELTRYLPVYNKRHNFNFVGTYTFGKDLNWEFSTRWNLGSGFPFTPTQGFYSGQTFQNGVAEDYTTNNSDLNIYYGKLNTGRLPYYHRLDFNLKKTINIKETVLEMNAGVTNAYNRENVFYFDRVKFKRVNQLPMLPSLGFNWKF